MDTNENRKDKVMKLKCVEVYEGLYHQEPFDVAFCPYRISPLGAHIDHQYGKINGLAIDKGIHMAYHPKQNGRYIYAIKEAKDRILSEAGSCITCLIICDRICQTIKKKRKETS